MAAENPPSLRPTFWRQTAVWACLRVPKSCWRESIRAFPLPLAAGRTFQARSLIARDCLKATMTA
jgi:hypothetical protein